MTDIEQREPVAAFTIDFTGCEHLSLDVANIERIAAAGSEGPTAVHHLYTGQQLAEVEARADAAEAMFAEVEAALDAKEIASGLTSDGNLWRFWSQKAKDVAAKLATAEAEAERLRATLEEAKSVLEPFKTAVVACDLYNKAHPADTRTPREFLISDEVRAARDLRDRLGVEG